MKVEALCTTDDPVDSLIHHKKIKEDSFEIKVLPTWRPDKATAIEDTKAFNKYIDKLGEAAGIEISTYNNLLTALSKRQEYFHEKGCRLSDHGLESFYAEEFTEQEVVNIFGKVRSGKDANNEEVLKFKTALLLHLAEMDFEKGWTQQFHIGALRNNNSRMRSLLGPDTGFDSIGDFPHAGNMSKFLDRLDSKEKLAKTILYNLNPSDNEVIATMAGNFNDCITPGKIQFGSGWWF
jgi:glucuronate isomerase